MRYNKEKFHFAVVKSMNSKKKKKKIVKMISFLNGL